MSDLIQIISDLISINSQIILTTSRMCVFLLGQRVLNILKNPCKFTIF